MGILQLISSKTTHIPLELQASLSLGLQPRWHRLIWLSNECREFHRLRTIAKYLVQHTANPASTITHTGHQFHTSGHTNSTNSASCWLFVNHSHRR